MSLLLVTSQLNPGRPKTFTPRSPNMRTLKIITARPVKAAVMVLLAPITASGEPEEVMYPNAPASQNFPIAVE